MGYEMGNCSEYTFVIRNNILNDISFSVEACPVLSIPEGVKRIGKYAFSRGLKKSFSELTEKVLKTVKELRLPSTLEKIDDIIQMYYMENLERIIVDSDNQFYKSEDGCLLSSDGKRLLCVPAQNGNKEFEFPKPVEVIGKYAFRNNKVIERIIIPERIKGPYMFHHMKALKQVVFPDDVKAITNGCFYGCMSLQEVRGTGLTKVGKHAFEYVSSIPTLPETITELADKAFDSNYHEELLKSIIIPPNVRKIGLGICHGIRDITIYDTIDPKSKGKIDTLNGLPNSNVGWIGIKHSEAYTLCAHEPNSSWYPHSITVRSAETGDIKYKVWMNRGNNPEDYYCRLASSWGANASFDFENVDKEFKMIRAYEDKFRYALYRLEYPYQLSDERKNVFMNYIKKNYEKIYEHCVKTLDIDLIKELESVYDKDKSDDYYMRLIESIKTYSEADYFSECYPYGYRPNTENMQETISYLKSKIK